MYTIECEIGHGGMGCVYRARDAETGRLVALKQMSSRFSCEPIYRQLFESEANTLRKINSKYVVKLAGSTFQDDQGNLCLPMEYIEGKTLHQTVKASGPYTETDAIKLMESILDAMQEVHNANCIHRDIKPSNIMIRPDGSICIIDFGIAKDAKVGASGQTVGQIVGTSGYMSPEQAHGFNIDRRTDIYSLGCLLYYLLSGHDAIQKKSNDYETRVAIIDNEFPHIRDERPDVSERIEQVILKATDKDMRKRYQTPFEFRQALSSDTVFSTNYIDVEVGRGNENDIILTPYEISHKHLTVRFVLPERGALPISVVLRDHSTNGTGINGRYYKQNECSVKFENIEQLPSVLLCGRSNMALNWNEVINKACEKGLTTDIRGGVVSPPPPPPPPPEYDLDINGKIFSLLIPFVGLWMYFDKKNRAARAANSALVCSLLCFVIYLIAIIIILIISQ